MTTQPARWLLPRLDEAECAALAGELGVAPLVARVLIRRGYRTAEQAHEFMRPSLDSLPDPFRMLGMRDAAARLAKAARERESILLYGDYDVDGT